MTYEPSAGWWNDIARAVFGFTEHRPLALEEAIRASLALQVDRPEWGFVGQELHCGATNVQPGVAGTRAIVGVRNPRLSNVLAVVTGFSLADTTATATVTARVVPPRVADAGRPAVTASIPGIMRDTRWENINVRQATCSVIGATPAALFGFEVDRWLLTYGVPFQGAWHAILAPGADFLLQVDNLATTLGAGFKWYERMLQSAGQRA